MMSADRYTARDLERLALHYAIEERVGWLGSVGEPTTPTDADAVQRARALVAGWTKMLKRRFGQDSRVS
jgi:hypothetical protein